MRSTRRPNGWQKNPLRLPTCDALGLRVRPIAIRKSGGKKHLPVSLGRQAGPECIIVRLEVPCQSRRPKPQMAKDTSGRRLTPDWPGRSICRRDGHQGPRRSRVAFHLVLRAARSGQSSGSCTQWHGSNAPSTYPDQALSRSCTSKRMLPSRALRTDTSNCPLACRSIIKECCLHKVANIPPAANAPGPSHPGQLPGNDRGRHSRNWPSTTVRNGYIVELGRGAEGARYNEREGFFL